MLDTYHTIISAQMSSQSGCPFDRAKLSSRRYAIWTSLLESTQIAFLTLTPGKDSQVDLEGCLSKDQYFFQATAAELKTLLDCFCILRALE